MTSGRRSAPDSCILSWGQFPRCPVSQRGRAFMTSISTAKRRRFTVSSELLFAHLMIPVLLYASVKNKFGWKFENLFILDSKKLTDKVVNVAKCQIKSSFVQTLVIRVGSLNWHAAIFSPNLTSRLGDGRRRPLIHLLIKIWRFATFSVNSQFRNLKWPPFESKTKTCT